MAKIKVKSKKDVVESDSPMTMWKAVREYVEQNARQIGAIGLAVAAVAAVIVIWGTMRAASERESLGMFYEAMSVMMAPAAGDGASAPAYDRAFEKFKAVHERHGGTAAGRTALLYAGTCAYNLKKYDDAVTFYKKFLDVSYGDLQFLKAAAFEGLGYACEGKADFKQAAEWFAKQKKENPADGGGMALLNLARVAEETGDKEKACSLYKEFSEKNSASGQKQLAQFKADMLCAKTAE